MCVLAFCVGKENGRRFQEILNGSLLKVDLLYNGCSAAGMLYPERCQQNRWK